MFKFNLRRVGQLGWKLNAGSCAASRPQFARPTVPSLLHHPADFPQLPHEEEDDDDDDNHHHEDDDDDHHHEDDHDYNDDDDHHQNIFIYDNDRDIIIK